MTEHLIEGLNLLSKDASAHIPEGVGVIEWDLRNEKVNKLSTPVILKLQKIINEIQDGVKNSKYKAIVMISRKPRIFIAGADIAEIQDITDPKKAQSMCGVGQNLLNQIEDIPIPFIAAINGACLGGGCEVVLACDYRIATDDSSTRIGLPETKLGVIPGFGGCWRLPRLIGLEAALDIILGGKSVNGKKALKLKLIDRLVSASQLEEQAFKFASQLITSGSKKRVDMFKPKTWVNSFLNSFIGTPIVFHQAKKMVMKKSGGHYPALLRAIEVIRSTYKLSDRQKVMKIEAHGFSQVVTTEVSKNLIRLFYMTEAIKKQTGISNTKDVKTLPVQQVGVLGAGTMGGGIAHLFADKGLKVRMKDITTKALSLGLKEAHRLWSTQLKRRRITKFDLQKKQSLLSASTSYEGFKQMDFIVEAVIEDMNIKKTVMAQLSKKCHDKCIIATNTSSLSVTEMAEAHNKPENVVGMHFFNPVHKMPLVEVIRGEKSSNEAIATTFYLAKKMGKIPVVVKDRPGFLVNRLLLPYLNEAVYLLAEGYPIEWIDEVFVHFGMPMGPFRLLDAIGIDVAVKVANIFYQNFGERVKPSPLMSSLSDPKISEGHYGKKSKKGFYIYNSKSQEIGVNINFYDQFKITERQEPSEEVEDEILTRPLYAMINEAGLALEEQLVEKPEDVDLAMIMGTGFPPFRGGLLRYVDTVGVDKIAKKLDILHKEHGRHFECSSYLKNLASSENPKFYTS